MGDAAWAAEKDGQTGEDELWAAIAEAIGPWQAKEWRRWWRRELQPAGRRQLAREALGELKIQQDLARSGARDKIEKPGAWFVSKFCGIAGIIPQNRKGGAN